MNRERRGYSLRTRPPVHRMTKTERDELLRILFEWNFAERIVNEQLKYDDIRREIAATHGLDVTNAQLKNLLNRWYCDYDSNNNIERIYRV